MKPPACAAWCVEHDADGDICHAAGISTQAVKVGLTSTPREGPRIWLGDDGHAPAEAECLAWAILTLVACARATSTRIT